MADALGDGLVDDSGDAIAAATPQFCDDRTAVSLDLGTATPVAVRALALDNAYAVAIETTANDIVLVELDGTGAFVGLHTPFTPDYAPLYGMSRHANRPAVHLKTSGESYIKLVDPGWDAYTTGPSGIATPIDPAYAEIGATTGIAGVVRGADLLLGLVDDIDPGAITATDYTPTGVVSGSIVPIPTGARVVVETQGGACETFTVSTANVASARYTFSPCYGPTVAAVDATTGALLYRTSVAGPYEVRLIPPSPTAQPVTIPLTGATSARITTRSDGAFWIGHGSASYRALLRVTGAGAMTEHREPAPARMFDLTARDAFWLDGTAVHVSTPCLR